MIVELFLPLYVASVAILLVVLRAGASRVFFDVVGTFQAERLIADARAKVGLFQGLMLDGITGITESAGLLDDQLQSVVDTTVPLARGIAEARLEFEKFANVGTEETAQMVDDITAFGQSIGFTADQALNAGSRMAQLGGVLGTDSIGAASEVGITFGLIGGMETQEAMTKLINLQQQTQFMMGGLSESQFKLMSAEKQANVVRQNSMQLLDSLNTIENRSSATMQGITHVMNEFAAAGNLAGDSINFMAAASAVLIERGEQQGKAGRALKQMYARLGADTSGVSTELERLGIATRDSSGQMRSMEDIMGDLTKSSVMNSDSEKRRIAQLLAGNDHYIRAIKLMEGYDRAMDLTTQSINDVDSAQEELNRKLEDEATLLTIAEARLDNAKAAIGDALVPSVRKATEAQASFNEELAAMMATPIGGFVTDVIFGLQQGAKMFKPFGEAYLNILSMNVSLKTQETIMRSLNGEEIARTSAYGVRGGMEAASLQNLREEMNLTDQLTMKKVQELGLEQIKLKNLTQLRSMNQVRHLQTLTQIRQQEASVMKQYATEVEAIRQVDMAKQSGNQLKIHDAYLQQQKIKDIQTEIRLNNNNFYAVDAHAQRAKQVAMETGYYKKDALTDEERLIKLMNHGSVQNKVAIAEAEAEAKHKQEQAVLEQQIAAIRKGNVLLASEAVMITKGEDLSYDVSIQKEKLKGQAYQETLNSLRQLKFAELEHGIQSKQNIMNTSVETNAQRQLGMMFENTNRRVAQAIQDKTNAQGIARIIDEEANRTAMKLAGTYNVESGALARIIAQLPQMTIHTNVATAADEAAAAASMKRSQSLMMLNGGLGLVSMSLSMMTQFMGDSELAQDAMQASMVAMTASMVIGSIQMAVMTKSMATQAAGMVVGAGATNTYTTATNGATVATKKLNLAMKASLIGLGIIAIAAIIPNNDDAADSYDELASAVDGFTENVVYSGQQIKEYNDEIQSMGYLDVISKQEEVQQEINDLTEEYNNATAVGTRNLLEDRLKALGMEKSMLEDIATLRLAEGMGGEISNQFLADIFAQKEGIEDAKAELDSIKDDDYLPGFLGLETLPILSSGHDYAEGLVTDRDDDISDAKDNLADLQEALGTGFGPGTFAYDALMAADSFQEFLDTLRLGGISIEETIEGVDDLGVAIEESFIGPIEAAKAAAFEFGNAREEMFFGMKAGNVSANMLKEVVNKGVETLINTTELIMNNTFNGMTTTEVANEITRLVEESLAEKGVNLAD